MKKLLLNVVAAVLTVLAMSGVATMSPAYAVTCLDGVTVKDKITDCPEYAGTEIADTADLTSIVHTIINIIIGIVGFVAVVVMILGGISFITSQGDTTKVTKARNTILYGVVGLIVALLAFAIVNFVLSSVFTKSGGA